jgi:hypothetical protein
MSMESAMWMCAEILDPAGNMLLRAEAEIEREADLVALVASINKRFRSTYPARSLVDDVTKAGCTIKIGAAERKTDGAATDAVQLSQVPERRTSPATG